MQGGGTVNLITSISIYPIPIHVGVQNFNLPQHSSTNFNLLGWGFELPSFNLPSTNFNLPGWWFELSTGSFNLPPRISIYPVGDLNFNLPGWWSKLHFTQIQFTPVLGRISIYWTSIYCPLMNNNILITLSKLKFCRSIGVNWNSTARDIFLLYKVNWNSATRGKLNWTIDTPWIRLSKPNCSNIDWVNWNSP